MLNAQTKKLSAVENFTMMAEKLGNPPIDNETIKYLEKVNYDMQ